MAGQISTSAFRKEMLSTIGHAGKSYWRGRLSTLDLLEVNRYSTGQLSTSAFIWEMVGTTGNAGKSYWRGRLSTLDLI